MTPQQFYAQIVSLLKHSYKMPDNPGTAKFTLLRNWLYDQCNNNRYVDAFIQCLLVSSKHDIANIVSGQVPCVHAKPQWKEDILKHLILKYCNENIINVEERFPQRTEVGAGTFGTVQVGTDTTTGKKIAIKFFQLTAREGIRMEVLREVAALRLFKDYPHQNVIILLEVMSYFKNPIVLLTLMPHSLRSFLNLRLQQTNSTIDDENFANHIIDKVCRGVSYIHSMGMMHRDIKTDNILCTGNDMYTNVQVADFGTCIPYCSRRCNTLLCTTLPYTAPEVLIGYQLYTQAIDIWAVGCSYAEMLLKDFDYLFYGNDPQTVFQEIIDYTGNLPIYKKFMESKDTQLTRNLPAKKHSSKSMQWITKDLTRLHAMLAPDPLRRTMAPNLVASNTSPNKPKGYACLPIWSRHVDISIFMRKFVVAFLIEIATNFKYIDRTLHLGVILLEMYMAKCEPLHKKDMGLISCTAQYIAALYCERGAPLIGDYVKVADLNTSDMLRAESDILQVLDYNLCQTTLVDLTDIPFAQWLCNMALLNIDAMQNFHDTAHNCTNVCNEVLGGGCPPNQQTYLTQWIREIAISDKLAITENEQSWDVIHESSESVLENKKKSVDESKKFVSTSEPCTNCNTFPDSEMFDWIDWEDVERFHTQLSRLPTDDYSLTFPDL